MSQLKPHLILKKRSFIFDDIIYIYLPIVFLGGSYSIAIIALVIFTLYNVFERFRNSKQIIIDSKGIMLCEEKIFHNWEEIKYAYIHGNFQIISKQGKTQKSLEGIKCNSDEIEEAIRHFSGRDIANYLDSFNKEIDDIIGDDELTEKVKRLFEKYRNYQAIIGSLILVIILTISIYLQIQSYFEYAIATGMLIIAILLGLFMERSFNSVKEKLNNQGLKDDQINKLALKYQVIYNKAQKILLLVLGGVVIIGAFIISFISANQMLFK